MHEISKLLKKKKKTKVRGKVFGAFDEKCFPPC